MSPAVETNVNVGHVGADNFHLKSAESPYNFINNFANGVTQGGEDIVPYMTRVNSPIRVTHYSSSPTMHMKRKSKVDEVSRSTAFNLRPLKRGDKVSPWNRFRSPDATLPSLSYIPPWVSVTKSDYTDPRLCNESEVSFRIGHQQFNTRSNTDTGLSTPRFETPVTPAISVTSQQIKTPKLLPSRSESRATGKTSVNEKRVTILAPLQNSEDENMEIAENVNSKSPDMTSGSVIISPGSPRSKVRNIKYPDIGVNYYSGYLPPELSEKIAEQLSIKNGAVTDEIGKQNYKPLVGDRTWFMKDPYPIQPKLYQSDIEQIRFEGHKRLVQSNGQATSHFSVLKRHGPSNKPLQNGANLQEATRTHQRLAKTAAPTSRRIPNVTTSIDLFERQREKTYHLQKLAREMINK